MPRENRAGIGFAPNGMKAMDIIEPRFRREYERICVGNRGLGVEGVFFEGMLLREGLGTSCPPICWQT